MKVVEKLKEQPDSDALLVEVAENEVADIAAMAMIIDGGAGDYSVDVRLVGTNTPPHVETIADHRLPASPEGVLQAGRVAFPPTLLRVEGRS
jgi:hypothetical protein